ncbi:urease subunit beta [Colwellia sp. Arc7-635]|jgi:urease subunit beta|uniref:urease subunit beta n=1 Tax=Colwellia sp. Arc7-635 TaxID=2497879 RepID=UPI000F851E39|nr:urease subunit beta [Colwellia sp. Arc7-635]AZQ84551.1 urease subunit beta [Colwellia sp. Arc7-635]
MIPGEIKTDLGEHELNVGREQLHIIVANSGDRPIQVGSHYHFFEVNAALLFERELTKGYRLDITSGTAVRFEPGQERKVTLIAYRGKRKVFGFRADVQGDL